MRSFSLFLLMGLLSFAYISATYSAQKETEKITVPPRFSIQKAIELAENCIQQKKIETKNMHIASAEYQPATQYWMITWATNDARPVPGSWLAIQIQSDENCRVQYGE